MTHALSIHMFICVHNVHNRSLVQLYIYIIVQDGWQFEVEVLIGLTLCIGSEKKFLENGSL